MNQRGDHGGVERLEQATNPSVQIQHFGGHPQSPGHHKQRERNVDHAKEKLQARSLLHPG